MKFRLFLAEFIFWAHVLIVAFWWGLLFVPSSWWPEKIAFHFYFTLGIVFHQFLWGFLLMPWTKKFRMVCALTTPMQLLRGDNLSDPKNYDHSFMKEMFGKTGLTVSNRLATILTFTILTIVSIQYFFLR
ncbi:MAG: hypothetical protein Q7S63_03140 [bacterium]|nr:hypothetical protein [bacterium]